MKLLQKLVQADTTLQKGELAAAEIIRAEFGHSGIESEIDNWDQNRANITTQIKSSGEKKSLLFVCHLDVVAPGQANWKYPPFSGVEIDGKIHGRGSTDMKGGTAAAVTAICEIVDRSVKLKGDIIFAATAGEEIDSCGVRRFVKNFDGRTELCGVIVPEPTDCEVVTAHRGMLWLEVTTRGKSAHGSAPQLGVNAIASMKAVLDELENYEVRFQPHQLLGEPSMSVNTIEGGTALNVVPDKCSMGIDIRTVPSQSHREIIDDLQQIVEKLKAEDSQFEGEVSVLREVGALETDSGCAFVGDFCTAVGRGRTRAVGFTTDGPYFAPFGAPVVIFGPGKPELCHKPDEYIDISDVEKAVGYYKNVILKFLS